jgi:two-component system OmpR family response regulator
MSIKSPLRVLLVEDSTLLAARLAEMIGQLPDVALVGIVDNEAAALGVVNASPPDVIVLDLHLRLGSGFGVLRALARRTHRPKIVILTNFGLPEFRREAESLGVEAFLDKSRDVSRLPSLLTGFAHAQTADGA